MKKLYKADSDREAFDLIKEHLLTQKKACGRSDGCYYDGSKSGHQDLRGMKCAIGALLTDEALEEFGLFNGDVSVLQNEACKLGYLEAGLNLNLLLALQELHDNSRSRSWKDLLSEIELDYL